jgi:hypothetical protein
LETDGQEISQPPASQPVSKSEASEETARLSVSEVVDKFLQGINADISQEVKEDIYSAPKSQDNENGIFVVCSSSDLF